MDKPSGTLPENHPLYAPGLKWRPRAGGDVPMWLPPAKDVKAGYLPKSLMLDRHALPVEIASACRAQWADLEGWRQDRNAKKPERLSIGWLVDRYLTDQLSPFHRLKPDTQQSYRWECARIKETIGERLLTPKMEGGVLVQRILGGDIRRWHHRWGHPDPRVERQPDGSMKLVPQAPTPSRARHCIAMLRTLASYNVELGTAGAIELRATLGAMRFEGSRKRTVAPTYEQVDAIVQQAEASGYRSIAITTLAQFELIERRTHIIGQWAGDTWSNGWVWEGVSPEWVIRYFQTKKGLVLREFDLKPVQRLLGLMQVTPKDQRKGPIIICEDTGEPWIKRRYQEKFREIARAAGVPDAVFSMDMRSGGVTEADQIPEVTPRMIQRGAGHADIQTQEIYSRDHQRLANRLVVIRQSHRPKK